MRQFVHQDQGGATGEGRVEIELCDQAATMADAVRGLCGQPLQQRRCLFTAVGFHHADKNIEPLRPEPLGFGQHSERFPDACTGTEEDFQFATMGFSRLFEQPVRIRAHDKFSAKSA